MNILKEIRSEEQSLEENVNIWKENLNDKKIINDILFSNFKDEYESINIDNHVYNDLEFFY